MKKILSKLMHTRIGVRRGHRLQTCLMLTLAVLFSVSAPISSVSGLSGAQQALYSSGVLSFDAVTGDVTSSSCGGTSAAVSFSTNGAAIWSILRAKGLSAVATAGIMGNFNQESNLDPAAKQDYTKIAIPDGGDGKTGFGLAQWTTQERQARLFTKLKAAGLQQYYGAGWGHPDGDKKIPPEDILKLITVELDYAWGDSAPGANDGDTTQISAIASQLNAAGTTSGDDGSTVLFHKLYERSADTALMIQQRVTDAAQFLQQYDSGGGEGGGVVAASCTGALGGVSTMEDAIPWGQKYINDTAEKYHPGGHALSDRTASRINLYVTNDGVVGNGGGCWGGLYCGQCTALVGWFVTNMTGYTYGGGNGGAVVGLDAKGKPTGGGLAANGVPTGREPQPFSIFSYDTSSVGHTGIVLGVLGGGEVITLENNLSSNTLAILKYNIKESHPDVRFAYVGDKLKGSAAGLTAQAAEL